MKFITFSQTSFIKNGIFKENMVTPKIEGMMEKPLIVITPHSSTEIAEPYKERLNLSEEEVMKFTDLYTDRLFSEAINLGGILIAPLVSKFLVGLNKKIQRKSTVDD